MLQQQQHLGRGFGASKVHLSPPPPPVALAAVRSKALVMGFFYPLLIFTPLLWDSIIVQILLCVTLCPF